MYIDGDEQMQFFSMFQSREMIHFNDTLPPKKNEHVRTKIMVISFPNGPCWGGGIRSFSGGGVIVFNWMCFERTKLMQVSVN